jgi:hypothetical protein
MFLENVTVFLELFNTDRHKIAIAATKHKLDLIESFPKF